MEIRHPSVARVIWLGEWRRPSQTPLASLPEVTGTSIGCPSDEGLAFPNGIGFLIVCSP